MGKLHWQLNNHFQHHGGAGFHALGFDPSKDLRQGLLNFMFDDDAMKRSEAAVLEQLPRMIHAANRNGGDGLVVETLFASVMTLTEDSHWSGIVRFMADGNTWMYHALGWGSGNVGRLGCGSQHTAEAGLAITHCSIVRRWRRDDGDCASRGQEQAHSRAVAGALSG